MKNIRKAKPPERIENEESLVFNIFLFFPEGIIALVFLLACPIQTVILFMHNRVASGIFLMACAVACVYSFVKLLEKKKKYFGFFVLNAYTVISLLIGLV